MTGPTRIRSGTALEQTGTSFEMIRRWNHEVRNKFSRSLQQQQAQFYGIVKPFAAADRSANMSRVCTTSKFHQPLPSSVSGSGGLTSTQSQCLHNPKTQRRRLHRVPQLSHDEHYRHHGIGKMLSPDSYDLAWHQYEGYLVERLNQLTAGTLHTTIRL